MNKYSEVVEEEPLLSGESLSATASPKRPGIFKSNELIQNNSTSNLDDILGQLDGDSSSPSFDITHDQSDIELGGVNHRFGNFLSNRRKSIRTKLIEIKDSIIYQNVGIKLMIVAQIFGSGMAATTRLLETSTEPPFKPTQVLFARMFITYVCCVAYMLYKKIPDPILGPKGVRLLLTLRGVFGFFGVFGFYYALIYLDLSDATVIGFLSPCVTGFLAWIFLGEVFGMIEIKVGIASLIGVIVIARPTFLLNIFSGNSSASDSVATGGRIFGISMSLVGVLSSALTFVVIRKIGDRAHPLMSVSYFALWCVIVSSCVLIFVPGQTFILPQNLKQWALLLALGMFGFVFQFMITAAIQRETAAVVTSIGYTGILWALLWERVIWGQVPDLLSWVGGSFIICSAIWMAYRKFQIAKLASKEIIVEGDYELSEHEYEHEHEHEAEGEEEREVGGEDNYEEPLEMELLEQPLLSTAPPPSTT